MNSKTMRELTPSEINAVSGAGYIKEVFEDLRSVIRDLPKAYDEAIDSMADMMCRASGKC